MAWHEALVCMSNARATLPSLLRSLCERSNPSLLNPELVPTSDGCPQASLLLGFMTWAPEQLASSCPAGRGGPGTLVVVPVMPADPSQGSCHADVFIAKRSRRPRLATIGGDNKSNYLHFMVPKAAWVSVTGTKAVSTSPPTTYLISLADTVGKVTIHHPDGSLRWDSREPQQLKRNR